MIIFKWRDQETKAFFSTLREIYFITFSSTKETVFLDSREFQSKITSFQFCQNTLKLVIGLDDGSLQIFTVCPKFDRLTDYWTVESSASFSSVNSICLKSFKHDNYEYNIAIVAYSCRELNLYDSEIRVSEHHEECGLKIFDIKNKVSFTSIDKELFGTLLKSTLKPLDNINFFSVTDRTNDTFFTSSDLGVQTFQIVPDEKKDPLLISAGSRNVLTSVVHNMMADHNVAKRFRLEVFEEKVIDFSVKYKIKSITYFDSVWLACYYNKEVVILTMNTTSPVESRITKKVIAFTESDEILNLEWCKHQNCTLLLSFSNALPVLVNIHVCRIEEKTYGVAVQRNEKSLLTRRVISDFDENDLPYRDWRLSFNPVTRSEVNCIKIKPNGKMISPPPIKSLKISPSKPLSDTSRSHLVVVTEPMLLELLPRFSFEQSFLKSDDQKSGESFIFYNTLKVQDYNPYSTIFSSALTLK